MRIAINTRLLIAGKMDGIGFFTAETTRRMVQLHPEHEFYLLFDRQPQLDFPLPANAHIVVLAPPARHPVLWYIFFEWSVTYALRRYRIDLFLSPDGWMSLRTKVPTLAVIHDINFEHSGGNLRPSHQRYMSHYFPLFARQASRIATVSDFSRNDIAHTYHIPTSKIDVVYDGAHSEYRPLPQSEQAQVRNKYTQGSPYFLFVSTIIRRKNLTNLLLAFDRFKDADASSTKLVVAGARVWWQDELKQAYDHMRHQSDVVFVGRIDTPQLARLMASAQALVYPSLFEGFGMPILEAFYSDTPVVTSNLTSMPEVAGDAALLVDPTRVDEIQSALHRIDAEPALRESLIQRGRIQRQHFSWDITTQRLWSSLIQLSQHEA